MFFIPTAPQIAFLRYSVELVLNKKSDLRHRFYKNSTRRQSGGPHVVFYVAKKRDLQNNLPNVSPEALCVDTRRMATTVQELPLRVRM